MSDVREEVSRAYAKALEQSKKGSSACCAPGPSAAACSAGYTDEDRRGREEAAATSFGCGNPLAFAGVEPGQTVLDLGSGAGMDLLIAADRVGPTGRVIGVDMTDEMLEAARENIRRAGATNVEVRKGHIEELPVADASVDWVISNCVINLSPDKPRVFREIARVLRPGGRISISDIVVEDLPAFIRENEAAYAACIAGAISEGEYLQGLRDAGLAEVEVTERLVYDAAQIEAMVASDLQSFDLDPQLLSAGLAEVVGKVWSAKVVGVRR